MTSQSPDDVDAAVEKARDIPGVATAIPYSQKVETVDGTNIFFFVVDDVEDLPTSPVYKGRPALHANEIVLGPGAEKRFGTHIGDTWTAKRNGIEKDFLVTGLASGAPNIGNFAILTRAAYQELAPDAGLTDVGVFITSADDSGTVSKALQNELGSEFQVVNTRDSIAVQMESYMSMIPLLSESLMAFNGLVVVLVVVLMTSSLVARSRHTAGLLKALGMTTRQAATRVRWTILPPLILGTVLGCAVGGALIRPLLEVLLSGVGIKQITVDIPLWPTLAVGATVLVTAVAAVFLSTRPINRVTAYSLLTE